MLRRSLPVLLLTLGIVSACATEDVRSKPPLPYWIKGICTTAERMADKDDYWLAKIASGSVTTAEKIELIESNKRAWRLLKVYVEHQRYMYESGLDDQQ